MLVVEVAVGVLHLLAASEGLGLGRREAEKRRFQGRRGKLTQSKRKGDTVQ